MVDQLGVWSLSTRPHTFDVLVAPVPLTPVGTTTEPPETDTSPTLAFADTPVRVRLPMPVTVTEPIDPVAEIPVGLAIAAPVAVTVPVEPVPETPVTDVFAAASTAVSYTHLTLPTKRIV